MSYFNADAATQDLGAGTITGPGAVQNQTLSDLLSNYHRTVAHSYKPIAKEDVGDLLPPGRLSLSPKLDGELWYLMVDEDDPVLVSPRGRVIRGDIPLLNEYRESLQVDDEEETSDVFISFSSKDMEKATRVVEMLREAGIKPWFSDYNMKNSGGLFQGQLQKQLEDCSAVLLLLSEGSCNSEWVPMEIANAHEEKKSISVLCLDEYTPRPGTPLKFHISHHQWEDGTGDKFEHAVGSVAQEIKEHLRPAGTVMAGELFVEKGEADRPRVSALNSLLSAGAKAEVDSLSFCAFDLVAGGDAEAKMPIADYAERYAVLQRRLEGGKRCRPVMTQEVTARDKVSELFGEWVEAGTAEGVVVRAEGNNKIYKVKPKHTIDAAVIGYTVKSGEDGMARSLLLAVMREDGSFQEICSCGNLGGTDSRKELFEALKPLTTDSSYRRVSGKANVLYQFVRPEIVVEIQLVDVQSEDAKGERIQKMVLTHGDDGWRAVRPMHGVSIHNPDLVRTRSDKKVNEVDVRATQFGDLCYVPDIKEAVEEVERSESTMVRREVYTKTAKGVMSVRKFLLWKTNKEAEDGVFPAYVVHLTDYSPARKDPLKREVRLAPTEEIAQEIFAEMLEKNIKKGWEPAAQ